MSEDELPVQETIDHAIKSAPDDAAALVMLDFDVTATAKPTLDDAARAVEFAVDELRLQIIDDIRLGYGKEHYETDVFQLVALKRAARLARAVAEHEQAVIAVLKAEAQKAREAQVIADEKEKDRKENARAWVKRRQDEKAQRRHTY